MVSAIPQDTNAYVADFVLLMQGPAKHEPAWLRERREQAIDRFKALGFPTTRHEDWRFTNVAPVSGRHFPVDLKPDFTDVDEKAVGRFAYKRFPCHRMVFVDGWFAPQLSSLRSVPHGSIVTNLADAIANHSDVIKPYLTQIASFESNAFSALNTAYMHDGAVVFLPRGTDVCNPVHILNITTERGDGKANHLRNLIICEQSSAVQIVEDYVALDDRAVSFNNAVTEVHVGDNAEVHHYLIERGNNASYSFTTLASKQKRDSRFESHSALFRGAIVRNNVHPILDGENAHSLLNGLFVVDGTQTIDNHMRVEHAKPNGDSRQFYRGILSDQGKGVFSGRIVVHEDAQKTDAKQSNNNLLLSEDATINTQPQLEIYADDVKCTHGATVGQLDEHALFYMQARGISKTDARHLLISAFAHESLEKMGLEAIRIFLDRMLNSELNKAIASDDQVQARHRAEEGVA